MGKAAVGFLVTIPVPYQKEYKVGQDLHPLVLIEHYLNAFREWTRIRILIGLNLFDNQVHLMHHLK